MEYQTTEGVKYQNQIMVGPEVQERIDRFMQRKNKSRNFIKAILSGIWTGINGILIVLGAIAVTVTILAILFDPVAMALGDAVAWLIGNGMDWARSQK